MTDEVVGEPEIRISTGQLDSDGNDTVRDDAEEASNQATLLPAAEDAEEDTGADTQTTD